MGALRATRCPGDRKCIPRDRTSLPSEMNPSHPHDIRRFGSLCLIVLLLTHAASSIAKAEPRMRPTGAGALPEMSPPAGVDVLTRSYQISRSGSNTNETVLTPAAVASGLRKIFSVIVTNDPAHPDDPRIEAQPLIVTGLRMNDGRAHDVLYVCTMNNNVWAFDANDGSRIWAAPVSLGNPVTPKVTPTDKSRTATEIDMWGINIHWGILSTPVIDRETETLFVVIWTSPDGSIPAARYELHAISLVDGKERLHSPKKIEARVTVDGVTTVFQPPRQKLRAALLLLPSENAHVRPAGAPPVLSGGHGDHEHSPIRHRVVAGLPNRSALVIACSQFSESSSDQHGWVLAYDTTSLEQTAVFCTTPTTGGGGIWQAGQGPAGDHGGNVYVITSNGGWNGITDFAETFLMLHYSPPRAGKSGKLELTSWFTPFRDAERDSTPAYDFKDQDCEIIDLKTFPFVSKNNRFTREKRDFSRSAPRSRPASKSVVILAQFLVHEPA